MRTKLLFGAWSVEVVAVCLGLSIAALMLWQALPDAATPNDYGNATIGALPFVLVAVVEAMKIPLTFAFFYIRNPLVKCILAVGLLAAIAITFESSLNGFERFYTLQVNEIEGLKARQADLKRQAETASVTAGDVTSHIEGVESRRTAELQELATREQDEISAHTERCKAVGTLCRSGPYIAEIRKTYEARRAEANARYNGMKADLLATLPEMVDTSPIQAELARVEAALATAVTESQIYRLAKRVFDYENAADVSEHEATIIAGLWYGSIALIAATTGVILAMAAAVLGLPEKQPGKTARTLRRLLLALRKRARIKVVKVQYRNRTKTVKEPVEVIKEIPVDRVVIKEVPKEIVVPHFIYVPVPEGACETDLAKIQEKALQQAGQLRVVN